MPVVSTRSWIRDLAPLFALAVSGAISCSGQVDDGAPGGNEPGSAGRNGGGNGPHEDGMREPGIDPGTKGVHRLNAAEYNATVADVLGTTLAPADASWLGGQLGVFDNMADVLHVDEDQFKRYLRAAGQIADEVFASNGLRSKLLICAGDESACVNKIIAKMGLRLFRRPLNDEEIGTFNKPYGAEAYELASRLSYFLWRSAPDEELLAAAADGSLLKKETLVKTIDRILNEPGKSARMVRNLSRRLSSSRYSLSKHLRGACRPLPDCHTRRPSSCRCSSHPRRGKRPVRERTWNLTPKLLER